MQQVYHFSEEAEPDPGPPVMSEVAINVMVIKVCSPFKEGQEGIRRVSLEVVSGSRTPW